MGLLGTVLGLMVVFQHAGSLTGGGDAAAPVAGGSIASGIDQALGCTAAGLALAIVTYVAHVLLSGLANAAIDDLDQAVDDLPLLLARTMADAPPSA
jgi:biopolymer transport protein ExbB